MSYNVIIQTWALSSYPQNLAVDIQKVFSGLVFFLVYIICISPTLTLCIAWLSYIYYVFLRDLFKGALKIPFTCTRYLSVYSSWTSPKPSVFSDFLTAIAVPMRGSSSKSSWMSQQVLYEKGTQWAEEWENQLI